jgi:hypothetical protein
MKKFLYVMVVGVLVFLLGGCGGGGNETTSTPPKVNIAGTVKEYSYNVFTDNFEKDWEKLFASSSIQTTIDGNKAVLATEGTLSGTILGIVTIGLRFTTDLSDQAALFEDSAGDIWHAIKITWSSAPAIVNNRVSGSCVFQTESLKGYYYIVQIAFDVPQGTYNYAYNPQTGQWEWQASKKDDQLRNRNIHL